jgi:hypothetical protein
MTTLVSKIQYKNFEPGEFVDVQERNFEETIRLIEEFPWDIQRDKIVIDLTNPSVTIEGKNGDFLKLAVFYNQKFVLLYLDNDQRLFSWSFNSLQDGYTCVKYFFEQPVFDTTKFKKETTWMQNNVKHFVTWDFRYELTSKSVRKYLLSTSGLNCFLAIAFLIFVVKRGHNAMDVLMLLVFPGIIFILLAGLPILLFFSYYNYVKNKILIMSKGNDIFYFGAYYSLVRYEKKDILNCTIMHSSGSRSLYKGFAVVKIEFKNGEILSIPNLLIPHQVLEDKLFQCPKVYKNKVPYL